MSEQLASGPAHALASRLRELRESRFPGVTITQRALGRAIGGSRAVSAPLISSWEKGSATPPPKRIAAYAAFFATERSVEGGNFRLLREAELTDEERVLRDTLHRELSAMRAEAVRISDAQRLDPSAAVRGSWHFGDGLPVRIVCADIPGDQYADTTPTHPTLAYGELYLYSSIDALFELHGHIRAANPHSDVRVLKQSDIERDDLSAHLVVLGGVDLNPLTRQLQEDPRLPVPIRQISSGEDLAEAYFEVRSGEDMHRHYPKLTNTGDLLVDVGLFLRAPNPFHSERTLTMCNGIYSLGTYGAVRALTDAQYRDRNEEFVRVRFRPRDRFSVLMRVDVVKGYEVVTPDWTVPDNRLHEWPE